MVKHKSQKTTTKQKPIVSLGDNDICKHLNKNPTALRKRVAAAPW